MTTTWRNRRELMKLGWTAEIVMAAWSYCDTKSVPDKSGYRYHILVETPDDADLLAKMGEELLEVSRAHRFQQRARRGLV